MPPTPPSSHGSDSEGSQSPVHAPPGLSCPTSPTSPSPPQSSLKASPRASSSSSSLSNSPLLTAPHVSSHRRLQSPDYVSNLESEKKPNCVCCAEAAGFWTADPNWGGASDPGGWRLPCSHQTATHQSWGESSEEDPKENQKQGSQGERFCFGSRFFSDVSLS